MKDRNHIMDATPQWYNVADFDDVSLITDENKLGTNKENHGGLHWRKDGFKRNIYQHTHYQKYVWSFFVCCHSCQKLAVLFCRMDFFSNCLLIYRELIIINSSRVKYPNRETILHQTPYAFVRKRQNSHFAQISHFFILSFEV